MRVYLVRHGQTPSNVAGLIDTAVPGPGLTDLGEQQAAAIHEALADAPIDRVFVSPITRTHLTAEPLMRERGLDATTLDGLREIEAGDLEMAGGADEMRRYLETAFAWGSGTLDARMPGVEHDGADFFARFDAAMRQVAAESEVALVVSHGAAIRTWVASRVSGVDPLEVARTPLANTGMFEIDGDGEQWRLVKAIPIPIGGLHLLPDSAPDPTAESLDEAEAEAAQEDSGRTRR